MLARKKCVIFDMDGCLVNTEVAYINAWEEAFSLKNIPIEKETIISWAGKSSETINSFISDYTGSLELSKELRKLREDFFWNDLKTNKVSLMPYAKEILLYTKENKIRTGIASSTIKSKADKILSHFSIKDFFDFEVFGDMVSHSKPAPDIYEKAVQLSGYKEEMCITFEDSIYGVMAANNAFVDVIYVPNIGERILENTKVFKEIKSLKEGIEILKEIDFG